MDFKKLSKITDSSYDEYPIHDPAEDYDEAIDDIIENEFDGEIPDGAEIAMSWDDPVAFTIFEDDFKVYEYGVALPNSLIEGMSDDNIKEDVAAAYSKENGSKFPKMKVENVILDKHPSYIIANVKITNKK